MNVGKTLFSQVMDFVPWKSVERIVKRYDGDYRARSLSCGEIFRVLAFSQFTWRESLRDIEACLAANRNKLFHMGLSSVPARSTLAEALELRDWRIFHDIAMCLIAKARKLYAEDDCGLLEFDATLYALDSTTIDLCLSLYDWAHFRSTKAAVKLHTLLDLRGCIPTFIHVTEGKVADVNVLDILPLEAGAFYVMDRGYVDFERLFRIHQAGAFFVTRAKRNMDARRVYSSPVDKSMGLICDQLITLNSAKSHEKYPDHIRRIRYNDAITGKSFIFLTNHRTLPALSVAHIYKNRWQVELFFKWIKQHLRIKKFLGTSENAVKAQIWCAIASYVLIAIIKKELKLQLSLYTLLQILSVSIFEKSFISSVLQPSDSHNYGSDDENQLILQGF